MRNQRHALSARWPWAIGVLTGLIALVAIVSFLLDEPLRRTIEGQINERLKGYTARIERLNFHPVGLSIDLEGVVIAQEAHPDPPVMRIPRLHASVQWLQLARARIVADFRLDGPAVYYNRQQVAKEAEDRLSPRERGWQEALQAIYPAKINQFRVYDGDIQYVDSEQARPLHLSGVYFQADNIRNIKSGEHDYPSHVQLSARVFDTGTLMLDGHADFLAVPHIGIKANFEVSGFDFAYFKPILERHHLNVRQGIMASQGTFEFAPGTQVVDIRELTVDGADLDYVHTPAMVATEREVAREAHETTKEVSNQPGMLFRAADVRVSRSTFGLINAAKDRKYRVFVSDTNLTITNLSNHLSEGAAVVKLNAKFMGAGPTAMTANFRPEMKGPDFDIDFRIGETDIRALNDLTRAYTELVAVQGVFSFYSELKVKNGTVDGYVKPLFRDLKVIAPDKEQHPSLGQKLKEKVVNLASKVLENRPRDEVATVAQIRGPIDDPKASTFQVIANLAQNAFFKAILPGFESEAKSGS